MTDLSDPGKLQWLISCDESGIGGARYYGFGSLWMKYQRRGDFARDFQALRDKHGFAYECKWSRVTRKSLPFMKDLVEYFFMRQWLAFHCIIVRKGVVNKAFHKSDYDLARRKHLTMLLTNKIKRCLEARSDREQTFRIYVDPIPSRYAKAHEAVEVIANNVLIQSFAEKRPVDSVITRDSKDTPQIQLCDVLLGAVMEAWQQDARKSEKIELQSFIASHIGWKTLNAGTYPSERKFNIWYFYDPTMGDRENETREIKLKYPVTNVM
jgi:Protein of unknown function (DUF3800)